MTALTALNAVNIGIWLFSLCIWLAAYRRTRDRVALALVFLSALCVCSHAAEIVVRNWAAPAPEGACSPS